MTSEAVAERRRSLTREERKVIIASSAGTVFEWRLSPALVDAVGSVGLTNPLVFSFIP